MSRALAEFFPLLLVMGSSLVTVGILALVGKISLGAFLAIVGGYLGSGRHAKAAGSAADAGRVNIEAGKLKVSWQGAAGLGIVVAGLLVILSAFYSST